MKASKKILSLFLATSIFFTGCSPFSEETNEGDTPLETSKEALPEVVVSKSIRTSFSSELSLSGTITAKEEITVASEVTGTVAKVLLQEGDRLKEGQSIMTLDSGTNLLQASYSSAQSALHNAKKALEITRKSSQQDIANSELQIKNAEIALENARIAYQRIKDSQDFTINTQEAQTQNAENAVNIAQKNLELAEKTLQDTIENEERIQVSLTENIANTISGTLIPLRSNMTFVDTLIGASEFRKNENDSFEVYLAGTTQSTMKETQDLWNQTSPLLEELEIIFSNTEKLSYSSEELPVLQDLLTETLTMSKRVRMILRNVEEMLYNSIVSTTFPEYRIESLKTQVSSLQQQLETNIQNITNLQQQILDFETQSPQRVTNAEINVSVMNSQLASAKDQLLIAQNAEGSGAVTVDSELENAKNAYTSAENALAVAKSQRESVKLQASLAEQSAISQMDSAQATMDQASLNLSKLNITSGIKGTISQILANDGDTVSPGTPLAIISDFSHLKLVSDVSVDESFLLKEGMKAFVKVDGVEKEFTGTLSLVYPEADKVTKRVRVEISIPNAERIPANVFATAVLELKQEKPEVYIPATSLISQNPAEIFIAKYDKKNGYTTLIKKEVVVGHEKEGMISIVKGLRPNEWVVVKKYPSLFDGDRVIIVNEEGESIFQDSHKEEENTPSPEPKKQKSETKIESSPLPISTTEADRVTLL